MKTLGWKLHPWHIATVTVLISASFCILVAGTLLDARRDGWDRASQSADNLAHAMAKEMERTVESLDLSLQGVIENNQVPGVMSLDARYRDMILFDRAATAKNFGFLMLLDAHGTPMASAQAGQVVAANFADRPYFVEHQKNPDLGLQISSPFRSKVSDEPSITLSRRIYNPDGSFGGVVVGTIRLKVMREMFQSLNIGAHGTGTMFHTDGTVVMRAPFLEAYINSDISNSEVYQRALVQGSGAFVAKAVLDDAERFHSFVQVGDLPLHIAVSLSVDDIEAGWWRHAILGGSAAGAIVCMLIAAAFWLQRELRKRQKAEAATRESEANFRLLAENCGDMVSRISSDGIWRYVSPASTRLLGKSPDQLVGHRTQEEIHPNDVEAVRQATEQLKDDGVEDLTITYRARRADGAWIWIESTLRVVRDPLSSLPDGTVAVSRDVTERKKVETELARLATLDGLTGIANRRSLDEALTREWRRCARAELPLSMLLVDVDKFKTLNDSQGHPMGDECLRQVGAIIGSTVRRASDFAARYGGEEFAVMLPETDALGAAAVAERVRAEVEALAFPNQASGLPGGVVTVSIGGATLWPVPGEEQTGPQALISMADRCLYEAKATGRNRAVHDGISFQLRLPQLN